MNNDSANYRNNKSEYNSRQSARTQRERDYVESGSYDTKRGGNSGSFSSSSGNYGSGSGSFRSGSANGSVSKRGVATGSHGSFTSASSNDSSSGRGSYKNQDSSVDFADSSVRGQMGSAGVSSGKANRGVRSSGAGATAPYKQRKPKVQKRSDFIKPTDIVRVKSGIDRPFLVLVIILVCFGAIMVFSASYPSALRYKNDSYYYIKRHLIFVAIGLAAMFFAARFDYRWLRKITIPVFVATLVLLVLVLAYGVASGKAQRWIQIGSFTIQPSEIMKFSLVILLALYIDRNQNRITNYKNFWQSSAYGMFYPFIIIALVCILVAAEGHFSGTIILFMIGMIVIFAAGARKIWFGIGGGSAALLILIAILTTDYAKERINLWLHPENYEITGKIWQTMQGLYAVGSGGLLGVGLGNSRQKHLYVSAPQNDFIFSIIAEELGFIGAVLVIVLFALLIWRGFVIALKAPDTFSSLVVIGIISQVAIQSLLNIGVVTNVIPNTGISLPFFSYGGSSIIMLLGEMGIVLSISRYSYQQK